ANASHFLLQLAHNLRRVDLHRLGDANQLDDVEPARAVLDLREIRSGQAEFRGDIGLFQSGALARGDENASEERELIREFGFCGDAIGATVARFHAGMLARGGRRHATAPSPAGRGWREAPGEGPLVAQTLLSVP